MDLPTARLAMSRRNPSKEGLRSYDVSENGAGEPQKALRLASPRKDANDLLAHSWAILKFRSEFAVGSCRADASLAGSTNSENHLVFSEFWVTHETASGFDLQEGCLSGCGRIPSFFPRYSVFTTRLVLI